MNYITSSNPPTDDSDVLQEAMNEYAINVLGIEPKQEAWEKMVEDMKPSCDEVEDMEPSCDEVEYDLPYDSFYSESEYDPPYDADMEM